MSMFRGLLHIESHAAARENEIGNMVVRWPKGYSDIDAGDHFEVESASTRPGHVRREAIAVMKRLALISPATAQSTWMNSGAILRIRANGPR
jgi:hypothetical protein